MMGEAAEAKAHFEAAIAAFDASGDRRGRGMATLGLLLAWHPGTAEEIPLLERAVSDAAVAGDKNTRGASAPFMGRSAVHGWQQRGGARELDRAAACSTRRRTRWRREPFTTVSGGSTAAMAASIWRSTNS